LSHVSCKIWENVFEAELEGTLVITRLLEEGFTSKNIGKGGEDKEEEEEEEEEDGFLVSKRGISGKVLVNASVAA